ncbi:hypothetical protein CHS0354_024222 [Potamilus streckersoni]|uniref:Suppressor of cytokine signaling 5 n=1 Tax=Potamilus streckersoni TaxID=2493646 RepID=A0AAE0SBC4_9BIVA|nr:hypothetical protein CHS0354_024222 [Potamilus streckersoni]
MDTGNGQGMEKPLKGSSSTKEKDAVSERDPIVNRHRIHRSTVRPFFCCGSQLSLTSLPENQDQSVFASKEDEYSDISDTDELVEDINAVKQEDDEDIEIPSTSTSCKTSHLDRTYESTTRILARNRKKSCGLQDKGAHKKSWTSKLKGKLHVSKPCSLEDLSGFPHQQDTCDCATLKENYGSEASTSQSQSSHNGAAMPLPVSILSQLVPSPSSALFIKVASGAKSGKGKGKGKLKRKELESRNSPLPAIVGLNELYPTEDIDEQLIAQRRQEMEEGIDVCDLAVNHTKDIRLGASAFAQGPRPICSGCGERSTVVPYPSYGDLGEKFTASQHSKVWCSTAMQTKNSSRSVEHTLSLRVSLSNLGDKIGRLAQNNVKIPPAITPVVHTQVDYVHFLVPEIDKITSSSYYWGVMDRYEAEKLIDNKPEGTFLLRDSAQEDFLFSVSFRRYWRSLHARIEQWNHTFSFDSRDPGVFSTSTVCDLIEHYKDPSCCMFFEPMLTRPLHRTFPFSLKHLCRAVICTSITYNGVDLLPLPNALKEYIKYYHYKQKVRVRRFDVAEESLYGPLVTPSNKA